MSEIVLVHPPVLWRAGNFWESVSSRVPPLGIAWIAAELLKRGHDTAVVDAQALDLDVKGAVKAVLDLSPQWVGITATTTIIRGAMLIAEALKQARPELKITLGGVHPTIFPEEVLSNQSVDFVVIGEGELTFPRLVENAVNPESVPGIAYRNPDGSVSRTRPMSLIENLDQLPRPAYHLLPMKNYHPALGGYKRLPAMSMLATRGCKGRCIFCYNKMWGNRIRSFGCERILDDIRFLIRRHGIREIVFYDDAFTCLTGLATDVCEGIIRNKIDITWSCMSRVDCVNEELLRLMRRAGCHQICFGIESGDNDVLRRIGKLVDMERIETSVRAAKRAGMDVRGSYIFGHPDETFDHLNRTLEFALKLDTDVVQFNIATPFPGTALYKWAKDKGCLLDVDWSSFDYFTPVMEQKNLPSGELKKFLHRAYLRYYLRPGFILKKLRRDFRPSQLVQYVKTAAALVFRS